MSVNHTLSSNFVKLLSFCCLIPHQMIESLAKDGSHAYKATCHEHVHNFFTLIVVHHCKGKQLAMLDATSKHPSAERCSISQSQVSFPQIAFYLTALVPLAQQLLLVPPGLVQSVFDGQLAALHLVHDAQLHLVAQLRHRAFFILGSEKRVFVQFQRWHAAIASLSSHLCAATHYVRTSKRRNSRVTPPCNNTFN